MEKTTCVVDGCDRAVRTSGMCSMHYLRVRRTGSTEPPSHEHRGGRPYRDPGTCKVDGCEQTERRAGYCGTHHQRLLTYGDPNFVTPRPQQNGVLPCSIEGCDKPSKMGGRTGQLLCAMHYSRKQRYGDPLSEPMGVCVICDAPFVRTGPRHKCCSIDCRKELVARAGYAKKRRTLEVQGTVEKFSRTEIFQRDNWMCHICGGPIDRDADPRTSKAASLDHLIPLSLGGEHSRANTRAAHHGCNARKGNRVGTITQIP